MFIQSGEVIGEDAIWYDERPCSYTARVSSNNAVVFEIPNPKFLKSFGKVVDKMRSIFNLRNKFIEKRCLEFKTQNQVKSEML